MSARRFVSCISVAVGLMMVCWGAPALAAFTHPFVSSFGSFASVGGVAIDQSNGDVYVLDTGASGGSLLKFDAAGTPLKFTGLPGEPTAITGLRGDGDGENEIAVDSSNGPAKGDVYVAVSSSNGNRVDVIGPGGEALGTLSAATAPWGESCGVAVDQSGSVYVGVFGVVDKFVPKANPVTNSDYVSSILDATEVCNLAVDSAGNVFGVTWPTGPVSRYEASQFGSLSAFGSTVDPKGSSLAVNPGDDHVYVNQHTDVAELGAHGEPFEVPLSTFAETGEGAIAASEGIAVDSTSGDIYVPDGKGKLSIFGPGSFTPTVTTGQASAVTGHSAGLSGSVNPEGGVILKCEFEYGTGNSYGHGVPCSTNPATGNSSVMVNAAISGLKSGATYHFRLIASNAAGESVGEDRVLTTAQAVITGGASNVRLSVATVGGSIDPEDLTVTGCKFEYGPTSAYGQSAPCATIPGSGDMPVDVTGSIFELIPKTRYHYRLVATDETGENFGDDRTLTTEGPLSDGIAGSPDGRVYEMVSPLDNGDAEVYEPYSPGSSYSSIQTERPFQAALDGNGIAYAGSPSVGGNEAAGEGSGNEYLARRSADGGWSSVNLSPVGFPSAVFQGFSSDLSAAFLDSLEGMSPSAPNFGEPVPLGGNYDVLYSTGTTGSEYVPVLTATPPYRSRLEFRASRMYHPDLGSGTRSYNGRVLPYAGASADSSHVLFEANDALTPDAEGGSAGHYAEENNLYESVGGQLRLVNVLPDGSTKANTTFGAPDFENNNGKYGSPDFSHVISADGSRIFWTDLNTGHIYVRENGTRTVEISPAGKYWTATADGSKVFYTDGDLYEYDVESRRTTDLTPGVTVQGVVGASENGEYIYYVTAGFDLDGVAQRRDEHDQDPDGRKTTNLRR